MQLRQLKRRSLKPIFNIYLGTKGGDPCAKLTCPQYASCVASFDGNSASCHCPDTCTSVQLSEKSIVCGKLRHGINNQFELNVQCINFCLPGGKYL